MSEFAEENDDFYEDAIEGPRVDDTDNKVIDHVRDISKAFEAKEHGNRFSKTSSTNRLIFT
jgi:hypothetical protein